MHFEQEKAHKSLQHSAEFHSWINGPTPPTYKERGSSAYT